MLRASEWVIALYRRLAPSRLRSACRFEPTCSEYALLAIRRYGAIRGWAKALARISRCRPPNGGIDNP
ncbi:membrane protein insertion efficiency factor YidD [Paraburkholderia adhaesiva]|uniref:membrane protein insertion efficiency factor YidD n=1 Tax=Paraburkholderia adhaesiva TaxID=2883244 RepID=UPI001F20E8E3|nr:membrane protein insertion efficiency factor YidD [Paraburkholderia adhaesiva]